MKRKFLACILIISVATLAGCGSKKEESKNDDSIKNHERSDNDIDDSEEIEESVAYESDVEVTMPEYDYDEYYEIYADLIDDFYYIAAGNDMIDLDGDTGVREIAMYSGEESGTDLVGYAIEDINNDGVPELIIANVDECWKSGGVIDEYGSQILAVYTCDDDEPVFVFEGWDRNRYYILEDGSIYNEGSAGASESAIGKYRLLGTKLKCDEFYFSMGSDDDYSVIEYYYNNTGEWNKDISEASDADEYEEVMTQCTEKIRKLSLKSFTTYALDNGSDDVDNSEASYVSVYYAEDIEDKYSDKMEITIDDGEYSIRVGFVPTGNVSEFALYDITSIDFDEEGKLSCELSRIFEPGMFDEETPFYVQIVMAGDTQQYAISYVNQDGNTEYYAVEQSGQDGSLILTEIVAR